MHVATQISGTIHPDNKALHALKSMLIQLGIHVTHPPQDESFFYKTNINTAWQRYNHHLFFYESIAASSFHIVHADDPIDEHISRHILYAMLKNRPIIMMGKLAFSDEVSAFTKQLIKRHASTFHSIDLLALELVGLSQVLRTIRPIDYALLGSEKILINARIKSHFRDLLDSAKA